MIINNGIAEALECGDIVNGVLIFPDTVKSVEADVSEIKETLEIVRNIIAEKAVSIRFYIDGREIYGISCYFPNLETFSAASLVDMNLNLSECKKLYSVYLPNVEHIGRNAFYKCNSLKVIDLPSIKCIDHTAFEMSGLEKVTLGKNIVSIGNRAFLRTKITEINVYGAKCGGSSFKKCYQLNKLIADKLTQISVSALTDCNNLVEISVSEPGKTNHGKRTNPFISNGHQYALCIANKVYECICAGFRGAFEYADVIYKGMYSVYVLKNGSYAVFGGKYDYGYVARDVVTMKKTITEV